jgi:hypothetical protein
MAKIEKAHNFWARYRQTPKLTTPLFILFAICVSGRFRLSIDGNIDN